MIALLLSLQISAHAAPKPLPFDLPPDATRSQVEHEARRNRPRALGVLDDGLDEAVAAGQRNHAWLDLINSKRADGQKLSFTSKDTTRGYPIDQANVYSAEIVAKNLATEKAALPDVMEKVLFEKGDLTSDLPVSEKEFLAHGLEVDRIYQIALRWRMYEPYLESMESSRNYDVTGYYFFSKMDAQERKDKLAQPGTWSAEERAHFSDWLISLCLNNVFDFGACKQQVGDAVAGGQDLGAMYDQWLPKSKQMWDSYFAISQTRDDISYDQGNLFNTRFLDPQDTNVRSFLVDNIEDEWHLGDWKLKLNFADEAETHIVFESGATPHVDGIAGSEITMNADQPLTEYDAQWTIRHEYGHTLGFTDCYLEYYDADRGVIVSYQLDIDNLMCSRRGHLQQQHVDELKRAYNN